MVIQTTTPPLPYSLEAEEAVLGSILIDSFCIEKVIGILQPHDFCDERCKMVYSTMLNIKELGKEINEITIGAELQIIGQYGLASYLVHLITVTPTSLDIEYYATEVKRFAFYRQLVGVSSNIAKLSIEKSGDIAKVLDKCDAMVDELRHSIAPSSRHLILGKPRLIQTNPPRYIWNVNSKDLRLKLREITDWGKFKNRVIAELNFVPDKPKNWDDTINALITHSAQLEAPIDASEEQQLKIAIQGWFERRKEAVVMSDLKQGMHIIRELTCRDNNFQKTTYYCFQSTPLIAYLHQVYKQNISSEDLWVFCDKWRGIKHTVRPKLSDTNNPLPFWCLPINFMDEKLVPPKQQEAPEDF